MSEEQKIMLGFIETRMIVNVYYPVTNLKAQKVLMQLIEMNQPQIWRLEFSNDYTKIRLFDFDLLPGICYTPNSRTCYWKTN